MRQVILDTETTGLQVDQGHRVVEIGCVEMVDRRQTGRTFHQFVNPQRQMDEGAIAVHGITNEQLLDKPLFEHIAADLAKFCEGAQVIIHNAAFDMGFLNAEFERAGLPKFADVVGKVTDSLVVAKELHPGKRNNLDILCDRYGVNNAHRTFHGALLDAQLLAEVWLAMTRGQDGLAIDVAAAGPSIAIDEQLDMSALKPLQLSAQEQEAHANYMAALDKEIKKPSVWTQLATPVAS